MKGDEDKVQHLTKNGQCQAKDGPRQTIEKEKGTEIKEDDPVLK